MTERTLGSIIMGGIAVLGVVWAVIEGVPPLVKAKKQEKELETKLVEIVSKDYGSEISELDVRRVTFVTLDIEEEYRGSTRIVKKPVISLEGINNKDEYFLVKVIGDNDYILDLQNKIGSNETAPYIALEYDVYQNYSMTLAKLLNEIVDDRDAEFSSYEVGNGLYSRVQSDAGATICEIGDIKGNYEDTKIYNLNEVQEAVKEYKYGERTEDEVYVQGVISSVETTYEESSKTTYYTIKLVTDGADDLHRVEVYRGKLIDNTLKGEDLVPGATILVRGYLSTGMAYKA